MIQKLAALALILVAFSGCSDSPFSGSSDAPLVWTARVGPRDGVLHFDSERVYTVGSTLRCFDRETGELVWSRPTDVWEQRGFPLFAEGFCVFSSASFDRKTREHVSSKITAIDLVDGTVRWEASTWKRAAGITVDRGVLYFVSREGRLGGYEIDTGTLLWDLDLNNHPGERRSYGGITKAANALLIGAISGTEHGTLILDAADGSYIAETSAWGFVHDEQFIAQTREGTFSFDLRKPERGVPLHLPGLAIIIKADDSRGALLASFDEKELRGWRLMDLDGEVRGDLVVGSGGIFSGGLLHVSKDAAYVLDSQFGVTAVRLETGEIIWNVGREKLKARYWTDVTVDASEALAVVTSRRKVHVLEAGSGTALWEYRLAGDRSHARCDGDSVFLVDGMKLLYFKQSSQEAN